VLSRSKRDILDAERAGAVARAARWIPSGSRRLLIVAIYAQDFAG
jgi:hypothetical protein